MDDKPGPVKRIVDAVAEAVREDGRPPGGVPGAPGSTPPQLAEPLEPRAPLPAKRDQQGPLPVSPTGRDTGLPAGALSQNGGYLTTAQGVRLPDGDHSLKAGPRGPVLLQDHHLREKIMHFDHERIPERVVHARGAAAHGTFRGYGTAAAVTRAAFLAEGVETPVFVRFSTVLGSRGSADTVRDTRGFATKFYTGQGVFDLVGNNIPVFFIQDAIKFPDVVHAAKPHPDREIPQAQSAHDTFWDFVSLHTEATHHTIWNMSDRGIPRSYRTMEGFGVHTFRLVNAEGASTLVKFHWKPMAGVHSLVWEEAQLIGGMDPDFHRRDLADAIESGNHPQWELGIQTFPDTPEQTFAGIDLLDPTKIVPEELAPVQAIGLLTLNANPTNFFAETEQVAFHPGHLVPGIDLTDDALLAGRLFSYLDTQITRLGGPNFAQIPVNRTHAPVNDMLRDGFHQDAVHSGVAPYKPNSLDGGCPFFAGAGEHAFVEYPTPIAAAAKVREAPASFADHFSQPRLFWLSLSPVEREHVIAAYTFELSKVYEQAIKERVLTVLARIDEQLCREVAAGLGLPVPPTAGTAHDEIAPSPALSQLGRRWPATGRVLGIVTGSGSDPGVVRRLRDDTIAAGLLPLVIAPTGAPLADDLPVQRTFGAARSVEFDALLIADAPPPGADDRGARDAKSGAVAGGQPAIDSRIVLLVNEAYRHAKPIAGLADARALWAAAGIDPQAPGVFSETDAGQAVSALAEQLETHRVWERFPASAH
ncbi:catalase [Kitasatospora sp. NBC_01246]|uniref:catalase n=1 Tax=Kitasatospora sp. NBC_01246 TaxID=2903570 RepID=UPI002E31FF7C|nr:catalase [Kitasatospora sp. NBC_01246]